MRPASKTAAVTKAAGSKRKSAGAGNGAGGTPLAVTELQRQLDEVERQLQAQTGERDAALAREAAITAERDETLARETATAEVLAVINASPGDLAPVILEALQGWNAERRSG